MGHIPHVLIGRPWADTAIGLDEQTTRHLSKVLRLADGDRVSYTDGEGIVGDGALQVGTVVRGAEHMVEPVRPRIVLAVAPPRNTDRQRFIVEKAAELAVAEIVWLATRHGEGRSPRRAKAVAWATAGLEQSRGAHRTAVAPDGVTLGLTELAARPDVPLLVAHPGGIPLSKAARGLDTAVLAIGPEGGFAADEIPGEAVAVSLGERILRVETAAIAAVGAMRMP
jgi:16S rRNA (uracil1498-N3)-methyltransferase